MKENNVIAVHCPFLARKRKVCPPSKRSKPV